MPVGVCAHWFLSRMTSRSVGRSVCMKPGARKRPHSNAWTTSPGASCPRNGDQLALCEMQLSSPYFRLGSCCGGSFTALLCRAHTPHKRDVYSTLQFTVSASSNSRRKPNESNVFELGECALGGSSSGA